MNFTKIDGYPDYNIYPDGDLLSFHKSKTTLVKPYKEKIGYMTVSLYKNGKGKKFLFHRLLATAFIPNPENKPYIDHINGIKDDNRLENLRWVTPSENQRGFRKDRGKFAIITKGGIIKTKYGWIWRYCMNGKRKSKTMKSKEDLEKYRKEKLILSS